jgi:hypothetical protein
MFQELSAGVAPREVKAFPVMARNSMVIIITTCRKNIKSTYAYNELVKMDQT